MKKIFILFTLIISLLMASCTTINKNDEEINENTPSLGGDSNTNNQQNPPTKEDPNTNNEENPPSSNDITNKEDLISYDKTAYEYFSNVEGLSESSIQALNLLDNAVEYFVSNNENKEKNIKYKFRTTEEQSTLEVNGNTLSKDAFAKKNDTLSTFIANVINIKIDILELDEYINENEFYYINYFQTFAVFTEYKENSITYLSTDVINGEIALDQHGYPLNSTYISLQYNPEDDTYYYDSFMNLGYMLLTNKSDLKNYAEIYQENYDGNPASIIYCDFNKLEEKYDEDGNLKDFSEYGEKAFYHQHMTHCQSYKGNEFDENGFYHTHYKTLGENLKEKFSSYTAVEYDPIFLLEKIDEAPRINASLYYLTAGFTKPIIDFVEYGTRPEAYACMEGFPFNSKEDDNYHLLVKTEDECMEIGILNFVDDKTYETTTGIFNVNVN